MGKQLEKSEVMQRVAENEALIALGAKQNFESILNVSMGLKGMKDIGEEVGWKTLGYDDFEDYTTQKWGMAKVQAYKYLHVAERLPKSLVHRVNFSSKASLGRLLALLPNDQNDFKLTPDQVEDLMLLPPDDFKKELIKLTGYDRKRDGGRGPSDIERPNVSRDRYRDQLKRVRVLEEKLETSDSEKEELADKIEKLEKQIEIFKRAVSPEKDKQEIIEENKALILKMTELEKMLGVEKIIQLEGEVARAIIVDAVMDSKATFNKMSEVILRSHEEWVEFRVWTDTIRRFLDECEDHVGFVMAEKGLFPKDYEEYRDGSFKHHLDKATENMKREFLAKEEKRVDEMIKRAKTEREQKKKDKEAKAKEKSKE